ncbi:hypothetical protein E2C01_019557 [Portunus trituberculatus]|uniref:Secreted protein n=1 Tax=Portunus trituberculatus TaxID=210409 RepID=A0A5B7DY83_PORTR|nr:hypothetical protein [Portunus trituberculatus]
MVTVVIVSHLIALISVTQDGDSEDNASNSDNFIASTSVMPRGGNDGGAGNGDGLIGARCVKQRGTAQLPYPLVHKPAAPPRRRSRHARLTQQP